MQIKCSHRRFYRLDMVRDELSPQAACALDARCRRAAPKRQRKFDRYAWCWRYDTRGRKPGQMVQIEQTGVSIEAGFSVKQSEAEFETACQCRGIALFVLPPKSPICNGCVERANAAGRYEFHQFYDGELSVGALNVELARFERFYNACRPHRALGQTAPMQAYNENFNQCALAA